MRLTWSKEGVKCCRACSENYNIPSLRGKGVLTPRNFHVLKDRGNREDASLLSWLACWTPLQVQDVARNPIRNYWDNRPISGSHTRIKETRPLMFRHHSSTHCWKIRGDISTWIKESSTSNRQRCSKRRNHQNGIQNFNNSPILSDFPIDSEIPGEIRTTSTD